VIEAAALLTVFGHTRSRISLVQHYLEQAIAHRTKKLGHEVYSLFRRYEKCGWVDTRKGINYVKSIWTYPRNSVSWARIFDNTDDIE
jgi:hypothetical protein